MNWGLETVFQKSVCSAKRLSRTIQIVSERRSCRKSSLLHGLARICLWLKNLEHSLTQLSSRVTGLNNGVRKSVCNEGHPPDNEIHSPFDGRNAFQPTVVGVQKRKSLNGLSLVSRVEEGITFPTPISSPSNAYVFSSRHLWRKVTPASCQGCSLKLGLRRGTYSGFQSCRRFLCSISNPNLSKPFLRQIRQTARFGVNTCVLLQHPPRHPHHVV